MSHPWGEWLVGGVGVVLIGVAFAQFAIAWRARFRRRWRIAAMSPTQETWATRAGRIGFAARGVVFVLVGLFFLRAAIQSDPSEARGLGGALASLLGQPYGAWLLALVALGLVGYAVTCLVNARYRHFDVR